MADDVVVNVIAAGEAKEREPIGCVLNGQRALAFAEVSHALGHLMGLYRPRLNNKLSIYFVEVFCRGITR